MSMEKTILTSGRHKITELKVTADHVQRTNSPTTNSFCENMWNVTSVSDFHSRLLVKHVSCLICTFIRFKDSKHEKNKKTDRNNVKYTSAPATRSTKHVTKSNQD